MGEFLDQIPANLQNHIKEIAKNSELDDGEDAIEAVACSWLEKKASFEQEISDKDMEELEDFQGDDERGGLLLTHSGSLVTLGPIVDGKRKITYTSIGLRKDVPAEKTSEDAEINGEIKIDDIAKFTNGPVASTSPIFKIAIFKPTIEKTVQLEEVEESTKKLADEFVEINKKTIILE